MSQFQIRKDDFAKLRVVEESTKALENGQIRVSVEKFAFTANNITYAATGDMLGYWQFFPAAGDDSEGWGVIPVWGFARVTESTLDDLPVGERLFGYFPPANQLTMSPAKLSAQRFMDGAAHRAQLPPGYNNYRRVAAEPGYTSAHDSERMLLWPLFITSFCLWDALQDNNWYDAQQVIVISASSKTSIGLGYALQDDDSSPKVIGMTSARNKAFVKSLGIYDDCVTYDACAEIDASLPTVIVDMSGNSALLGKLHRQLGEQMKFCINVGLTHWDESGANPDIITERSEFFFAPGHIQKRMKDWGPEGFDEKTSNFITRSSAKSRDWLKLKKMDGLTGLTQVYGDVCAGRFAPDEGILIEFDE